MKATNDKHDLIDPMPCNESVSGEMCQHHIEDDHMTWTGHNKLQYNFM